MQTLLCSTAALPRRRQAEHGLWTAEKAIVPLGMLVCNALLQPQASNLIPVRVMAMANKCILLERYCPSGCHFGCWVALFAVVATTVPNFVPREQNVNHEAHFCTQIQRVNVAHVFL